jgi:hypothetical protein
LNRTLRILIVLSTLVCAAFAQGHSADEEKVWSQEQAYWKYVQASDIDGYRTLWHKNFLGWPYFSPEPARKNQITDWITAHKNKGETLKSYELERRVLQTTDNLVTVTYRVHANWVDKNGVGTPESTRIIHTWIRNPDASWQIISGMSAPTDANKH